MARLACASSSPMMFEDLGVGAFVRLAGAGPPDTGSPCLAEKCTRWRRRKGTAFLASTWPGTTRRQPNARTLSSELGGTMDEQIEQSLERSGSITAAHPAQRSALQSLHCMLARLQRQAPRGGLAAQLARGQASRCGDVQRRTCDVRQALAARRHRLRVAVLQAESSDTAGAGATLATAPCLDAPCVPRATLGARHGGSHAR